MRSFITWTTFALAVAAMAAGCQTEVRFEHGPGGECGDPPPLADGWCPPAWSCIDGQWVDTAGACRQECPAEPPPDGSACAPIGQACHYDEFVPGNCGYDVLTDAVCTVNGWISTISGYDDCEQFPDCPTELPLAGSDCSDWYNAYACDWQVDTPCGNQWVTGYCDGTNWVVDPVPACGNCAQNTDAAICSIDPSCQWLEPGCGGPPLPQAGCFPADGCDSGCTPGETCTTVVVNPCWNSLCDACGAETDVCLPGS